MVVNILIGAVSALAVLCAAACAIVRGKRGGGCCGDHEEIQKRVRVKGQNYKEFRYRYTAVIGGMVCAACARKLENAINMTDGMRAAVRISDHTAVISSREPLQEQILRGIVSNAGYSILEIEQL